MGTTALSSSPCVCVVNWINYLLGLVSKPPLTPIKVRHDMDAGLLTWCCSALFRVLRCQLLQPGGQIQPERLGGVRGIPSRFVGFPLHVARRGHQQESDEAQKGMYSIAGVLHHRLELMFAHFSSAYLCSFSGLAPTLAVGTLGRAWAPSGNHGGPVSTAVHYCGGGLLPYAFFSRGSL